MNKPTIIDLKDYRQPMITSLGIIVGFLLGFLGQWVTEATFSLASAGDMVTFFGCIAGIALLLVTLFRMLSPREPSEDAVLAYRSILRVYGIGVAIPLVCILVSAFI